MHVGGGNRLKSVDFKNSGVFRKILLANVVAQVGIVITGGLVRVTSSGLGCPTWPECVDGSITPTSQQTEAWHKYVEFGNRLLTFALGLIAILVIIAVRNAAKDRKDLKRLSYGTLGGIFAQAILGGITVLTKLNPLTVAAHFLLSIALIAIAFNLYWRSREPGEKTMTVTVPLVFRTAVKFHTALALLVILIGTLVTGSGPHAGDAAKITRLPFDPRVISWFHADLVLLFIGLTIGLIVAAKTTKLDSNVSRAATGVLHVSLLQGLIGYVQYFSGLPWLMVALHIAGSCLVWLASLRLLYSTRSFS